MCEMDGVLLSSDGRTRNRREKARIHSFRFSPFSRIEASHLLGEDKLVDDLIAPRDHPSPEFPSAFRLLRESGKRSGDEATRWQASPTVCTLHTSACVL